MDLHPDTLDWNRALQSTLDGLPALGEGRVRLYRVEPGKTQRPAPWLEEALAREDLGRGRWFTEDAEALLFYVHDQALAQPRLLVLDVDAPTAEAWRVANWTAQEGLNPKSYSRDPQREFFLPDVSLRPTTSVAIEPLAADPRGPGKKPSF